MSKLERFSKKFFDKIRQVSTPKDSFMSPDLCKLLFDIFRDFLQRFFIFLVYINLKTLDLIFDILCQILSKNIPGSSGFYFSSK